MKLLAALLIALLLGAVIRWAWRFGIYLAAARWIESPGWCDARQPKPWYVRRAEKWQARRWGRA